MALEEIVVKTSKRNDDMTGFGAIQFWSCTLGSFCLNLTHILYESALQRALLLSRDSLMQSPSNL